MGWKGDDHEYRVCGGKGDNNAGWCTRDKVGLIVWTAVMRTRVGIVRMTGFSYRFRAFVWRRQVHYTSNFDADAMRIRDILRHWVNNPGLDPTAELI